MILRYSEKDPDDALSMIDFTDVSHNVAEEHLRCQER